MRKYVALIGLMIVFALPTFAHALSVRVIVNNDSESTTAQAKFGSPTVNIAGTYTGGGATVTIAPCERTFGCSGGLARVFADDQGAAGGSINKLVLTDAKMTTNAPNTTVSIQIVSTSGEGDFVPLSPAGLYPYAVAMNGRFDGVGARNNQITVSSAANGGNDTIGNLQAAPFSSAVAATFNQQALKNIPCPNNSDVIGLAAAELSTDFTSYCFPALTTQLNFSLVTATSILRLPNSIDVLAATETVENGGGAAIASALAALSNPGGPKVVKVSLEPSPGSVGESFRSLSPSDGLWTVGREGNGESKTRAEISIGGSVKVKAEGLCPEDGCVAPNTVNVSVFCGDSGVEFVTALPLDQKGKGEATVATSVPCLDPAVAITIDEFGETRWIAAPAIGGGSF